MKPRKTPCASCPYRRDVPSGVWAETEYQKLEGYDGETWEQPMGVFCCHQDDGQVCSGWAAVHGNRDNMALRMAPFMDRDVDVDAVLDYATGVPLFSSGREAAEHGRAEIRKPGDAANTAIRKISKVRTAQGRPVRFK